MFDGSGMNETHSPKISVLQPWLDHRERKRTTIVDTIVLHATAGGTLSGALATLRKLELSYHFIIDRDGAIMKCVPVRKAAYHAGISIGPSGEGVNEYSVGISFVNLNDGRDPYSAEQEKSVRALIRELRAKIRTIEHLTTHAAVSPGRKTDPKGYLVDVLGRDVGLAVWRP